jgi:hypothetical protein
MENQNHTIPADKVEIINQLLQNSEEQLGETGKISATQAFNLGCSIGIIPAGFIILVTFIATRSWFAALVSTVLMFVALISCANLVALIARSKSMERVYRDAIQPNIQSTLKQENISEADLTKYMWENVPITANLYHFFPKPPVIESSPDKRRSIFFFKKHK